MKRVEELLVVPKDADPQDSSSELMMIFEDGAAHNISAKPSWIVTQRSPSAEQFTNSLNVELSFGFVAKIGAFVASILDGTHPEYSLFQRSPLAISAGFHEEMKEIR